MSCQTSSKKTHTVQSICLLNIERAKAIPKSHVTEQEAMGTYSVVSSSCGQQSWTVDILAGYCMCPSFQTYHIPCKHMFSIFPHYPKWSWGDLPQELTNSSHMSLDHEAVAQAETNTTTCGVEMSEHDNSGAHSPSTAAPTSSGLLSCKISKGNKYTGCRKALRKY